MKNLKIAFKIALIAVPLEILLILSLVMLGYNMRTVVKKTQAVYYDTLYNVNHNLLSADRDFCYAELFFTRYVETPNFEKSQMDDYHAYTQSSLDYVTQASGIASKDDSLYKETVVDGVNFEETCAIFADNLKLYKGSFVIEMRLGDLKMQKESFDTARNSLLKLQEITESWALKQADAMNLLMDRQMKVMALIYGAVIVLSSIAVFTISHGIGKGIRSTKKRLDILATNDLTVEVPDTKAKDEVGQMTRSFKTMQNNLRNIVSVLYAQSDELAGSCSDLNQATGETSLSMDTINSAASELAKTATQTASDVEAIASDMSRLTEVMERSGESTESITVASSEIDRATKEGMDKVENLIDINRQCMEAFDSIFAGIASIEESSERIIKYPN